MNLIFLTSNTEKFKIAEDILKQKGISLIRKKVQLDEVQSTSLLEISEKSALEAFQKLKSNIAVTDVGFYITALNGFPGPFVKYINQYLSAENIISLMSGIENREIIVKECLVVISAQSKKQVYWTEFHGKIAEKPSACNGTAFEKVFIPDGFSMPIAEYPPKNQFEYWKNGSTWNAVDPADFS